jgi:hypothetical protein
MSASNVLAARDVNMSMQPNTEADANTKPDVMSMEHHRQVFQSKMEEGEYVAPLPSTAPASEAHPTLTLNLSRNKTFISPSDNIMSPCTAKLSAFRSKQVGKYVAHSPPQPKPPPSLAQANRLFLRVSRVKPKSLFAQASAKKLEAEGGSSGSSGNGGALFGSKPAAASQENNNNPFGN